MDFEPAIDAIIEAGRWMDRRGWVPSVSGNLSVRFDRTRIAITRSGVGKGRLTRSDIIAVDLDGRPEQHGRDPSAETSLHCQLYRTYPEIGAVLHGHSLAATVLSRLAGDGVDLTGYEMIKAFDGRTTHDVTVRLPIFDNDQDMPRLCALLAGAIDRSWIGYMLRGHGVYAWGGDMADAMSKLDALEFLIACALEEYRACQ